MKIKVCGLKYYENIKEVISLNPNYIGFIFYKQSPRFVGYSKLNLPYIDTCINKVGVFVNESTHIMVELLNINNINFVQLSGSESHKQCEELKNKGFNVIKSFGISNSFDFNTLLPYIPFCSFFIFDTYKKNSYGGTGQKFDWKLLENYNINTPFMLSGGIGDDDVQNIKKINDPRFLGVDINSRFEIEPALKDRTKLNSFFNLIKTKL